MKQGSAGIIILNELMPVDLQFDPMGIVDSKVFKAKITKFAKKYPKLFATNISKIAVLGEAMAFSLGANIGPKDLKGDPRKSKALIKKLESKLKKATTDTKKRDILLNGLTEATDIAKNMNPLKNEMVQQVRSGSRGKPVQFARMAVGPIYAVDMDQLPKLNLIKNNFTNGLSAHEYFNVSSQGRFASVQSANATSVPGALGKVLIANVDSEKISSKDCLTSNGTFKSITDPHIMDHYSAGTKGRLITKDFLKSYKGKRIKIRTPITCASPRGICVKCYGLKANGRLPHVGENVGISSGQVKSAILTQMTISTKHSTMGKGESDKLEGVEGYNIIANSPSSFTGAALVAELDGKVTKIEKAPHGGTNVYIGRKKYYANPKIKVKVKIGDNINRGDAMSTGVVTPQQAVQTRGLNEAREHESDMLHDLFLRSTGQNLMKKHFDILARGHLALAKDKYGEISMHSHQASLYPKISKEVRVNSTLLNQYIAKDIGHISKGTLINKRILNKLNEWGVTKVYVTSEKPSFQPIFKSLEQKPTFIGSIFQKMNYRNIAQSLKSEITATVVPQYLRKHRSDRGDHTSGLLKNKDGRYG
jgi:DNA-directed RNA polymerase subunit beta'